MVYFLKDKDSSNMLFKTHRKKIGKRNKKHLSVCIVKGRGYLLTNFSFLALVEDGVETINQGIYFENEIVIST